MRRITLWAAVLVAIAVAYGIGQRYPHSSPVSKAGHVLYYVDPMHPAYKSDKPGIAPDCGMPLVPVYATDGASAPQVASAQLPAGTVAIDRGTRRLLGIRVAAVERNGASRVVRAVGRVAPEDTRVYRINSGVDGYIQETDHDSVGLQVKKDQKLAAFYSPDFLAVASGFLAASERMPGANGTDGNRTMPHTGALSKQGLSSLQGYADRLRNLGMSDVQLNRIAEKRELPESIDIVSPADGFILARNVSPGQHFEHAMELYRIADLSKVWVLAEVSEQDAGYLRPGTAAQVLLRDIGHLMTAMVTDSLPQSETGGGTVKLRLEVDNPTFMLRPEMLVDVQLPVRLPPSVTVPVDAVVDSGERSHVYVERAEGVFEPREVETGWRFGEQVEILHGVQPGERVVVSATFLVDSESRMNASPSAQLPVPHPHKAADMPQPMATALPMAHQAHGR